MMSQERGDSTPGKNKYDDHSINYLPKGLNLEEKKYLLAVERGDLTNVKRILHNALKGGLVDGRLLDGNCVDSLGRGALILAIESENLEMLELLIVMGLETKDSLLHAIDREFVEAVELLLDHEELLTIDRSRNATATEIVHSWQTVDPNAAKYPVDATPLILAAQRNNYEILKLLLDRGASLPIPHHVRCGCEECLGSATADDPLRLSSKRISEYKALSSPNLIALSSPDPFIAAFRLASELRDLARAQPESKNEYSKLREQVEQFAVDLLHQVRSTIELTTILNYDPNDTRKPLQTLELAIEYKQKKFVAHSHIQQVTTAMWYEGVPGFRRKSTLRRAAIIAKTLLLFPFYCLVYLVAPESNTGQLMRRPFIKFLVHASSYLFFLFVLMLVSQRAESRIIKLLHEKTKEGEEDFPGQRGSGPSYLEIIVIFYVVGFMWQESKEAYIDGMRVYLRDLWNFIDFARNSLYFVTGSLRLFAYLEQQSEIKADPSSAMIPRENWPDYDPQLIAEGLFAAANILSALKLVHLFSINPRLGPLQISLGRMVIDIVKFFAIYSLVLFSFACGLNQLLWYFAELERRKCYSGMNEEDSGWDPASDPCIRWRRFSSLFESCQSLFWASFGGIGIDTFELAGIKSYTRFWGLLMFGSYSVINVIVLLNLLIAMMSNSYTLIEEHADAEWKFARTKLWMSYFEERGTLPPPFNIFPTLKPFFRICGFGKKKNKPEEEDGPDDSCRKSQDQDKYGQVTKALVWRYVVEAHAENDTSPVTEDDIHQLKSDITGWRCELLDVLERNGMDVEGIDRNDRAGPGKKMKILERRLMRDFSLNEKLVDKHQDNVTRWKRAAKLAVEESARRQVLASVGKSSQIGQSTSEASLENQWNLKKAMSEVERITRKSCPGPIGPIELPQSTSTRIMKIVKNVIEEANNVHPNVIDYVNERKKSPRKIPTIVAACISDNGNDKQDQVKLVLPKSPRTNKSPKKFGWL